MDILCLDFETVFDADYTLKKMTTEQYVRHPRFEAHGCGLLPAANPAAARFLPAADLAAAFAQINWAETAVLCHHAQFDGLILSHHYGVKPGLWLDTMSMGRSALGNHVRVSLASLAKLFGLEEKTVPYNDMRGKRWVNMWPDLRESIARGCIRDCEITLEAFKRLLVDFPEEELTIIDQTIRMFTEPRLIGDQKVFYRVQLEEWTRKNEVLMSLGVSERDVSSGERFVKLLEEEGVEIEYKTTSKGETPAIAKTDYFLQELLDDPNPRVASLAAARLEIKSTIEETRAGRLAAMSARGAIPVYLAYANAHTLRWAGGDKVNFQNFPREGELRRGLKAPQGHKLIIVDLAQIECRLLNWIAGPTGKRLVHRLASGGSKVYVENAEKMFKRPISKKDDLNEYTIGKKQELGCGYGMGWKRFRGMVYGDSQMILSEEFCRKAVDFYRDDHPDVQELWRKGDSWLRLLETGGEANLWGLGVPLHIHDHKIYGPNGTHMVYRLRYDPNRGSYMRGSIAGERKIWGGGLIENIIQYLARIVMSQAAIRIQLRFGYRMALTAHDEGVWIVPKDQAEGLLKPLEEEMARTPLWLPECPLGAEGKIGEDYGK